MTTETDNKNRTKRGEGRLFKIGVDGKTYPSSSKKLGVWWIDYTMTGANGKRKRIRKALKDEKGFPIRKKIDAQKIQKELIGQYVAAGSVAALKAIQKDLEGAEKGLERALDEASPPLKIVDAWNTYKNSHERPDSGDRTLRDYEGCWSRFTLWIKDNHSSLKYMRDIKHEMAQGYATQLTKENSSPNTFNKHMGFLKLIFHTLEEPARLKENPFQRIRKKKLKTNTRRELTLDELKDVLNKSDGDIQLLLYLGTFTGLRLGDCATLKWGEVDLDRGLIRRVPNKTASRKKNPVVVGIPPALFAQLSLISKSKRRGYVLPAMAEDYDRDASILTKKIQKHFQTTCKIQTLKEQTGKEWFDGAMKDWEDNKKKDPKPVYKRAVVEVGFHSLRHTFVSINAEQGTPQAVLQAIVGHGNPAMTAHYTHIGEDAARKVAGALDINITDAEYEIIPDPLPKWAIEKLKIMTKDNWAQTQRELICEPKS